MSGLRSWTGREFHKRGPAAAKVYIIDIHHHWRHQDRTQPMFVEVRFFRGAVLSIGDIAHGGRLGVGCERGVASSVRDSGITSWNCLSTLFTINSGRQTKLDNRKNKSIRCTAAAQKITTYGSIYKTDSPHSYTVTKTCLVFLNSTARQFNSKIAATFSNNIYATSSK